MRGRRAGWMRRGRMGGFGTVKWRMGKAAEGGEDKVEISEKEMSLHKGGHRPDSHLFSFGPSCTKKQHSLRASCACAVTFA